MIRTALGGEGFFDLQKEDGTETCAPPRSGLVQPKLSILIVTFASITLEKSAL